MPSKQRLEINERFLRAYRLLYADGKVDMKKEYCAKTGLTPQNFSLIENGGVSCTVDNICNLARTFGVSLDWIFFGSGEFYKKKR